MNTATIANHPGNYCDQFDYWWDIEGAWVEPPNHRRNGLSGVKKIISPDEGTFFVKIQRNHLHRSLRYPFGRPTAMREAEGIAACHRLGIKVPEVIYCDKRKVKTGWQTVLVTRELKDFISLEQWFSSELYKNDSGKIQQRIIQQMAHTLSIFHRAGWQHGCLYPKHIFLRIDKHNPSEKVEVALIDLEKCRRRMIPKKASQSDLGQLRRHLHHFSEADWLLLSNHYQHYFQTAMTQELI